ncbi:MAG: methionyl-tRNA formyltransferase [Candidatus Saccharimonas sp.]
MSKTARNSGSNRPIIFFGTEDFSLYSLRALVEHGFTIAAVVTKPDTQRGRGKKLTAPAVKAFASSHNIPVWQPARLADIVDNIKSVDTPIGVLVSYGKIIPESILELFHPGIINVHPSLLPKYRGPSPVESAIINRDNHTGVTIMKLVKAMDAGPIYTQVPYALDFTETRSELYEILGLLGANILVDKLPAIIDATLVPEEQVESDASYCTLLSKEQSWLDISAKTPGELEAQIRAHLGYPKSRLTLGTHEVIVTKAHGVMTKKTPLDLECANGAFLSIDELVAPSGKVVSADAFLRGYPLS